MADSGDRELEYVTDLRISESSNFADICIEANIPGVSKWKKMKGQIKVKDQFDNDSFTLHVETKSSLYGLEYNGKQLYKPIVGRKCKTQVEDGCVKIILRKKEAETWREDSTGMLAILRDNQ
ncbi:uncharacterized protein LOC102807249 [Saccoglossus kowalevskii]|uniref:Uncharacterized protein LOC102807249 n=1 Tax=Saccoglossus kowalevskii TaxID=10224 RepID=A0ABM0MYM2_SACKO|nr:PREDICTED: uncharacterized protein LOC102807249 [Saccoglossus kowalevskii]